MAQPENMQTSKDLVANLNELARCGKELQENRQQKNMNRLRKKIFEYAKSAEWEKLTWDGHKISRHWQNILSAITSNLPGHGDRRHLNMPSIPPAPQARPAHVPPEMARIDHINVQQIRREEDDRRRRRDHIAQTMTVASTPPSRIMNSQRWRHRHSNYPRRKLQHPLCQWRQSKQSHRDRAGVDRREVPLSFHEE